MEEAGPGLAATVIGRLGRCGQTVATAESLTGGLVCAALTAVPGASSVIRGGVIVYATDTKESLAGVGGDVLERHGPVSAATAAAMAGGVRERLSADLGVATTGVAGPDSQDGHPPGTVHVAVATPAQTFVRTFAGADRIPGDRAAVREITVTVALRLLSDAARRC